MQKGGLQLGGQGTHISVIFITTVCLMLAADQSPVLGSVLHSHRTERFALTGLGSLPTRAS